DLLQDLAKTSIHWGVLALLGIIMSIIALGMEYIVDQMHDLHMYIYHLTWSLQPAYERVFIGYCPGIPEMKTILRGVQLKEYLTIRTLLTKLVGLTLVLCSGLPLGKEGPFVHIASIIAAQLSKLMKGFKGIYENESRSSELLAAGCAVGVACTFSAPIGGVLFSIEVTSVYFAVRNYWRGFFSSACAAIITRIFLPIMRGSEDPGIYAFFQTMFPKGRAFIVEELPIFALIGIICGLLGAAYVRLHRRVVLWLRRNWCSKKTFQRHWFLYPLLASVAIGTLTFPSGLGHHMSGEVKFTRALKELFYNCSFVADANSSLACPQRVLGNWDGPNHDSSIFFTLTLFTIMHFVLSIVATTIPIPAGNFYPLMVLGAALGRGVGELVYHFSGGHILSWQGPVHDVYPGVYAVVGAAAFAGAVTQTVSVAVIIFEITNQLLFLLPVLIGVLVSNAVASYLAPSLYDSIIRLKHLPYLPDIRRAESVFHSLTVCRVMTTPVEVVHGASSYLALQQLLAGLPRVSAFPVVDKPETMNLIGSVSRNTLNNLLEERIGTSARRAEATRRFHATMPYSDVAFDAPETSPSKKSHFSFDDVISMPGSSQKSSKEEHRRNPYLEMRDAFRRRVFSSKHSPREEKQIRKFTMKDDSGKHLDLIGEERVAWEESRLSEIINVSSMKMDTSPFVMPARTTLYKMHSLFSLLGLNRAYVVLRGHLIGVVALREVREMVELGQAGLLSPPDYEDDSSDDGIPRDLQRFNVGLPGVVAHSIYDGDDSDYEDNLQ
ncbi:hypothetical protein PMAYCL1PPCAC_04560, partial [Pristionchus mayeri]